MPPLSIGLVGCGDVAHRDYLPELHRLHGRAVIRGVTGRSRTRAAATAERYAIPIVYDSLDEMLRDPEIAAVVDLTPIAEHESINRRVLTSGRHLYTEKPCSSSAADARELDELARRAGTVALSAPCFRLWPQFQLARTLLPSLGTPVYARARAFGGRPPWPGFLSDPTPFFREGAGPLRDMGVYAIDALISLLGPVIGIHASTARTLDNFVVADGDHQGLVVDVEVPDTWLIVLTHDSGVMSVAEVNFSTRSSKAPELEIMGTDGTLAMSILDSSAPVVATTSGDPAWTSHSPIAGRLDGPDHMAGVVHLVDCILGTEAPVITFESAAAVLDVIEQCESMTTEGQSR